MGTGHREDQNDPRNLLTKKGLFTMKKIVVALLTVILAAPAFAAVSNANQIKALQEKLATADKPTKKANIEAEIAVFNLENPTFDGIVAAIVQVYAKYSISEKKARSKACHLACYRFNKKFVIEAFKMATADHSLMAWRLVVANQAKLGLTDQAAFDFLAQTILSSQEKEPAQVKQILSRMLVIAPNCDPAKVKTTLQKINRLLSPRLLKDKAKWEPSVAMVRTALETY